MQKEEKIVVVLLIMAALSLTIGYYGFSSPTAVYSSNSKVGEHVYVEGTVLSGEMTAKGDNLILVLSNLNIKIFVSKDNGAKEVYNYVKKGDKVRITGIVSQYKNVKEIVVENAKDVMRL